MIKSNCAICGRFNTPVVDHICRECWIYEVSNASDRKADAVRRFALDATANQNHVNAFVRILSGVK